MSITFTPQLTDSDIAGWEIRCYEDGHNHDETYPNYGAAAEAYQHLLEVEQVVQGECLIGPRWSETIAGAEVNMSSRTTREILSACSLVGTEDDIAVGECDPVQLLTALVAVQATRQGHASTGGGSAVADGRSHAELVDSRIAALIELCTVCIRTGRPVTWG